MRVLVLLVASLLLSISPVHASNEPLSEDQRVGEGLMLILKGEKQKAWEVLFPEAKKGNVVAMFHLGSMMMRSPEYPDYLERAQQFYKAAAQRGHGGSKLLLSQVEDMLKKKANGAPTLIAGVTGGPTPEQMEEAKRRIEKYKNEVLRYTGYVEQLPAKVTIKVFLPQSGSTVESLYSQVSSMTDRFPDAVKVEYYVIIDPSTWQLDQDGVATTKIPPSGFTPDFKGTIAATYGIKSAPAIVLAPEKGNARVISNPNDLITEITKLL